jgi:hypothetical protein
MDSFPASLQRPALLEFAAALGSADNALKRDECGDWRIDGKFGHVYAYAPGRFQFFVRTGLADPDDPENIAPRGSKQAWTFAKKALAFARLCNDGDDEGGFFLDRLPTKAEAKTIRAYCVITKRPEISAQHRAGLAERGRVLRNYRLAA